MKFKNEQIFKEILERIKSNPNSKFIKKSFDLLYRLLESSFDKLEPLQCDQMGSRLRQIAKEKDEGKFQDKVWELIYFLKLIDDGHAVVFLPETEGDFSIDGDCCEFKRIRQDKEIQKKLDGKSKEPLLLKREDKLNERLESKIKSRILEKKQQMTLGKHYFIFVEDWYFDMSIIKSAINNVSKDERFNNIRTFWFASGGSPNEYDSISRLWH